MNPTHEPPMDQDMTPRVRDWLRESALTGPDATRGLDKLLTDFPTTPQRRRWWRIAWPNRGRDVSRSVTGYGSTSSGRSPAMFGPFRLAVASIILVIVGGFALVRLAEPSPQPPLLAGATLVVAADGSGDYTTISAAVTAAADGDIIQVMPGHYLESVAVVGKDVTITGVGDRDEIIVEAISTAAPNDPADEPDVSSWAFFLMDTSSTLSNLTVVGQERGTAIPISGVGSAPVLDGLVIRLNGQWTGDHTPVWWTDGAGGALRNSVVEGFMGVSTNAGVIIEDNEMPSTCIVLWDPGAQATIRNNTIRDCPYEFGIKIEQGSAIIEGNDISVAEAPPGPHSSYSDGRTGIVITSHEAGTVVHDNDIHDNTRGIGASLPSNSQVRAEIDGNRVVNNVLGITVASDHITLRDNTVTGSTAGVLVSGGSPTLTGNTITGNKTGLQVGRATPTLTGNTICDNGANLSYEGDGEPPSTEGNEICADTASAAPAPSPDG
jgi:parallel beta-helix repeat protein